MAQLNRKRSFAEYSTDDFYLCSKCDAVYQGQQQLCDHLAKHSNLGNQARKKICIRRNSNDKDILDNKKNTELIPLHLTNNSNNNNNKLSGINKLTQTTIINNKYYIYHKLKRSLDIIDKTRINRAQSMKTSLNIIHDINILKHNANLLKLPISKSNLFKKIESKILGSNFKQPKLKSFNNDNNDKNNNNNNLKFDSSDFQRYLDGNSEIIGRLQSIKKSKSFYGVTGEEIKLNQQFGENITTMVDYVNLPKRLLN